MIYILHEKQGQKCCSRTSPFYSSDLVYDVPGLTHGVNELGHLLPGVPLLEGGAAQDQLHSPPVVNVDWGKLGSV